MSDISKPTTDQQFVAAQSTVYRDGYAACLAGVPIGESPYATDGKALIWEECSASYREWANGWRFAEDRKPAADLRPCPFCGGGMRWRKSMQAVHLDNDCFLSGMMFLDENAQYDGLGTGGPEDHYWNRRVS